jgi:hypothetical protein
MYLPVVLMSVLLWVGTALAAPPKPTAKELSQEARTAFDQADKELDPTKANELRMLACDKWEAAFALARREDYQFALGFCYRQTNQTKRSETAFRLFLALAPLDHTNRPTAEQALLLMEKPSPALVFDDPLPIQETSTQWKRKTILVGGTLVGLGLIGGAIVFGVLKSQDEFSRGTIILVEQ